MLVLYHERCIAKFVRAGAGFETGEGRIAKSLCASKS